MWVEKCNNENIGKARARKRGAQFWFKVLGIFAAVFLFTFLVQKFGRIEKNVEAANLANFDPGYIISDYQMGNYNSMSEEEIQAFLTSKNPCNNTNYNAYVSLTNTYPNIKWHFENGHFICLSEELFGDGEEIGSGETAARIIWQAAQDYKINPQVLIVLLQKEQGLITDDFPNSRQYRSATGYGCPDTAACSSKYYGFKNQVRRAAAMFRTVLNGGWTNYPLGENYIQYNPAASCGGSIVNIKNLATSALYRYTPYQPNAAALSAGYGTAYCGAYGNRNFYSYFEDWFSGITKENQIIWYKMETPRYLSTKKETFYYDLTELTFTKEKINKNEIKYYVIKTITSDNKLCLKTEEDNRNNLERCVLFEELEEPTWVWGAMETPRYLKSSKETKILKIGTNVKEKVPKEIDFYDEKMVLPSKQVCLRNSEEFAEDECVLYDEVGEVDFKIYEMLSPRYLAVKGEKVHIIDPILNEIVGELDNKEKYYFEKKTFITKNNQMCLLLNTDDGRMKCVLFSDLEDIWVEMERPRMMRMLVKSFKVNSTDLSLSRDIILSVGMQRKFVAKKFMPDDTWCLQTEYDNERKTEYCIRYNELGEI